MTYHGHQELIAAAGPKQRRIFTAGAKDEVDGGTLLGVHPLGGVVKMPSGNYYIYPLGRRFAERVKLSAKKDEELASAIDIWSRPATPENIPGEGETAIDSPDSE